MAGNRILSDKVKRQVIDTVTAGIVLTIGSLLVAICLLTLMGRI